MTGMVFRWPVAAIGTLLLVAAADGGDTPAAYRLHAPVTPAAGAGLQRLTLPAAVLAALQRADGGDLRLFDAHGTRLPMARAGAPEGRARRMRLDVLPIVGTAMGASVTGLALRLDGHGGATVARLDDAERQDTSTRVLGALFDARDLEGTARSLVLDLSLPAGQPVTFDVEASADLTTWRSVAQQVVYRPAAAPASETLALGGGPLAHEWLRLSWHASTPLVAPVVVRGAALTMVPAQGVAPAPTLVVRVPPPADAHAIELLLPFATPLSGFAIVPVADAIVPVRLLGRADAEQPWVLLGQGSAVRIGGVARSGTIALDGPTPRQLRIEADARSDGFGGGAVVTLRFDPAALVFAGGTPPLTLAAGRADAADRLLPLSDLLGAGAPAADALPEARIGAVSAAPPDLSPPPAALPWRRVALWTALLGATAVLGAMAWRLARTRPTP